MSTTATARPGMLTLALKDKHELYAAYMPWLKHGGVFCPMKDSDKGLAKRSGKPQYSIGDSVFMVLTLPESSEKLPLACKVVWITPDGAQMGRSEGIGLEFPEGNVGENVRRKIENLLAGLLNQDKPTQTM